MKVKSIFLIFSLYLLSCEKKELYVPFDIPDGFKVSKGIYFNKVELKWDTSQNINTYEVYRALSLNEKYSLIGKTNKSSFIDSTISTSIFNYFYKIRVYNSDHEYSNYTSIDSGYISQKYELISNWGDFNMPYSIDFDSKNNIFVSDPQVGKVKKFDMNGNFISDFINIPGTIIRGIKLLKNNNIIIAESNLGKIAFYDQDGVLILDKNIGNTTMLREIATDDSSNIYIVDMENKQIIKLDSLGNYKTSWKTKYSSYDMDSYPEGLEVCDSTIAVSSSDLGGHIEFFSKNGKFLYEMDLYGALMYIAKDIESNLYLASFDRVIKVDTCGKVLATIGLGFLEAAKSVNVNSSGDVFVTDEKKPNTISVFRIIK
jgi:hypothetical protein